MIVTVGGARLWTAVTGEGPPVILLHGGPGAPDYLGPLAEMLPARVHRFEQRGCGRSEDAESNDIDALLSDVDALRAHWGLDRFTIAGHSWGAALALLYALEHPGRVDRLLYLNGMGIEMGWQGEHNATVLKRLSPEERARYQALLRDREAATDEDEIDRLTAECFFLAIAADCSRPESLRAARGLLRGRFRRRVNQRLHAEWVEKTRDPALRERAAACRVPALLVQGAADSRPNRPAERLAGILPDARYRVLPDAGHFPWMDRPDAFLAEVAPFLRGDPQA